MENFRLIRNALINELESKSVDYRPLKKNLGNTLYTRKVVGPNSRISGIYNQKIVFDIPRHYNNLHNALVECRLTCAGEALPKTELGARIFKSICLQTRNRVPLIERISPQYTLLRANEIVNTPMYSYIQNCIDPEATFDTNTVTVYVPLFAFFSEHTGTPLKTRFLEQLELECVTNDNYAAMGLAETLTDVSFKLHLDFYDTPIDKIRDRHLPDYIQNMSDDRGVNVTRNEASSAVNPKDIPIRKLPNTYDVFYERVVTLPAGSTSYNMLLRNPHPSTVMHMLLQAADQSTFAINRFDLECNGSIVFEIDCRTNFSLDKGMNIFNIVDSYAVSKWFGREQDRTCFTGEQYFSGSMASAFLTVYFDALDQDYDLHVFHEYPSILEVNEDGQVTRRLTGSMITNTEQTN